MNAVTFRTRVAVVDANLIVALPFGLFATDAVGSHLAAGDFDGHV